MSAKLANFNTGLSDFSLLEIVPSPFSLSLELGSLSSSSSISTTSSLDGFSEAKDEILKVGPPSLSDDFSEAIDEIFKTGSVSSFSDGF